MKTVASGDYHHGNLKRSLIETATEIILDDGVEGLTMRRLSDRIGVSRTAAYRHFPDKTALLCAVAEDGFVRLQKHLQPHISDRTHSPLDRLKNLATTYVEFGMGNATHYRLMFGTEVVSKSPSNNLQAVAKTTFDNSILVAIATCQEAGLMRHEDPLVLTNIIWATIHGLTSLLIDGQIPAADMAHALHKTHIANCAPMSGDPLSFIGLSIDILIDGMIPNSSAGS